MRFHNIVLAIFSVASAIPLLDPPQYNGQSIKGRNELNIGEDATTDISPTVSPNSPHSGLDSEKHPSHDRPSGGGIANIVIGILGPIILCITTPTTEGLKWLKDTSEEWMKDYSEITQGVMRDIQGVMRDIKGVIRTTQETIDQVNKAMLAAKEGRSSVDSCPLGSSGNSSPAKYGSTKDKHEDN